MGVNENFRKSMSLLLLRVIKGLNTELPIFVFLLILISLPSGFIIDNVNEHRFSVVRMLLAIIKNTCFVQVLTLILLIPWIYNLKVAKYTFKLIYLIIFLILFDVYFFLWYRFYSTLTKDVVTLLFQTNWQESSEFIHSYFSTKETFLILGIDIIVIFLFIFFDWLWRKITTKKHKLPYKNNWCILTIFISLFILSFSCSTFFNGHSDAIKYNNSLVKALSTTTPIYNEIYKAITSVGENREITLGIEQMNHNLIDVKCCHKTPHIVLVIGESFIKAHSNLYGYNHNTNPTLKKEFHNGNLIVFFDVLATHIQTNKCLPSIFSIKRDLDLNDSTSLVLFPAIFKKAGYNVAFFSNQDVRACEAYKDERKLTYFLNPASINSLCFDHRNDKRYRYDHQMIEQEIIPYANLEHPFTLSIIQLMGQHQEAYNRYPHGVEYDVFNVDSVHRSDIDDGKKKLISDYDNATLYNDYILGLLIDMYRNQDGVIIITSDHGESIYDDSDLTYGRGLSGNLKPDLIKSLHEVPFFVWCSDKYINNHPEEYNHIRENCDKPMLNDDLCHLLFDITGIETKYFDKTLSPINQAYLKRNRVVNHGNNSYNYDINKTILDTIVLQSVFN